MNTKKRARSPRVAFAVIAASLSVVFCSGSVTAAPRPSSAAETKSPLFPVKALRQAADSSEVRLIKTVEQLPPSVRAQFRERTRQSRDGKSTESHLIDMADPGKPWNAGCVISEDLPSRQLQFAGITKETCFVLFNTGGFASRQWVAVFDLSRENTPLLGVALAVPRCSDLAGLRKMVRSEPFLKALGHSSLTL